LAVLALLAAGGAVVALQQRGAAIHQRDEARRAAANAEYRRLVNAASTAPTRSDSIALSLAALDRSDEAGIDRAVALHPLTTALARRDLPLLRFTGHSANQGLTGERQGVDVSLDGSTLAFVGTDGNVAVWSLRDLRLVAALDAAVTGGAPNQIGLSPDGSHVAVLSYPPTAVQNGADLVDSVVSIFDVRASHPAVVTTGTVPVLSSIAISLAPDLRTVSVIEGEGPLVIAHVRDQGFDTVRLGTAYGTSNAGVFVAGFSLDGRRACSYGEVLQVFDIESETVLANSEQWSVGAAPDTSSASEPSPDPLGTGTGNACLPEPCGGSSSSFMATLGDGELRCYEPDGTDITPESAVGSTLRSAAYTGLVPVEETVNYNGGWSIQPMAPGDAGDALPVVSVRPPPAIESAWARDSNDGGLFTTRLAQTDDGPAIVTVHGDGVIQVWAVRSEALNSSDVNRYVGTANSRLLAVDGSSGLAGRFTFVSEPTGDVMRTHLIDTRSGNEVGAWDRPMVVGLEPFEQEPIATRMVADDTFVEVFADGTLRKHRLGRGPTDDVALEVEHRLLGAEVDLTNDRIAYLDGGKAMVADLSGAVLTSIAVAGSSCTAGGFSDDTAYVDLAEDDSALAAVTCGESGSSTLDVARYGADGGGETERYDLQYQGPGTVSVANGGRVVAVATTIGQVGILHDGEWIEPTALQAERYPHNQYQTGWVAVDPAGRFVVTRLDASNIELWAVDTRPVERITQLTEDDRSSPPAFARFAPDSNDVTIGWDSTLGFGSGENVVESLSWSLSQDELVRTACNELSGRDVPAYAAEEGVTVSPACRRTA
jgi:WD40 repeat protein